VLIHRIIGLLALGLGLGTAQAQFSSNEVHVGVITDMNGPFADIAGQGAVIAAEMAKEDIGNKIGESTIKISVRHHGNKRDTALAAAESLRQQGVDIIVELGGSDTAVWLQRFATEHNIVALHSGSVSPALTSEECSPVSVHWTSDASAMAAAIEQSTSRDGKRRWFVVYPDDDYGRSFLRALDRATRNTGGIVGAASHQFGQTRMLNALKSARASQADAVLVASSGTDLHRVIRESYEFSYTNPQPHQIIPLSLEINDIRALGLYVTAGLRLATAFYWDLNPETRAWSKRFKQRHGAMPTAVQAGVYSGLMHYFKAISHLNSDEAAAAVKQMKAMPVRDFFAADGRVREDGRMEHPMYLVEVKRASESSGTWDYYHVRQTVPAATAFRKTGYGRCMLESPNQRS
jgi:branched-chain amino acid transport system substrate-binding protein